MSESSDDPEGQQTAFAPFVRQEEENSRNGKKRDASLPISIAIVNGILSACFQIPMLPLLHILNTRVGVPAKYLPAYGAIAFLPLSLRPLIAYWSSILLGYLSSGARHQSLLAPALCLGVVAHIGTASIPEHGILACFAWGFGRGVVNAWLDFLLGMVNVELAQTHSMEMADTDTYKDHASLFTAQSRTAKNAGSLISSVFTFFFYLVWNDELNRYSVSFLLYLTALLYATAAFLVVWYESSGQYDYVSQLPPEALEVAASSQRSYKRVQNDDESCLQIDKSELQPQPQEKQNMSSSESSSAETEPYPLADHNSNGQAALESAALVVFQLLLAASALHRLIVSWLGSAFWTGLIAFLLMLLTVMLLLGFSLNQPTSHQQSRDIAYYQLNLYFLLRNALPSSGTLLYSFQYTVFAKEPIFLQILSLCQSSISTAAAAFYERFLTHFNRGWALIRLIAALDILSGLSSLLDIFVIRAVVWDSEATDAVATLSLQFRLLCAAVEIVKSFVSELDYLPTAVLSAANVQGDRNDGDVAMTDDSICRDTNEDNLDAVANKQSWSPNYSSGMQYASFLSAIDFGFQVAEWISIPLVAALQVTRDNDWANLDTFVLVCSTIRLFRPLLLWLLKPKTPMLPPP